MTKIHLHRDVAERCALDPPGVGILDLGHATVMADQSHGGGTGAQAKELDLDPDPPIGARHPVRRDRTRGDVSGRYDIQHGTRAALWTALMQPVVARLSEEEMVAIVAYAASRMP